MSLLQWARRALAAVLRGVDEDARRVADARFVVLDVDVTGTSVRDDRVTGVAALPVVAGAFRVADLCYCPLPAPGGPAATPASATKADFAALRKHMADAPIVTYNPEFVREMILRTSSALGLPALDGEWIDLAVIAGAAGGAGNELATMQYWLARMRAGGPRPHDAVYDVFSMAQLLQAVIAYAEDAGIGTVPALARAGDVRAWLRG